MIFSRNLLIISLLVTYSKGDNRNSFSILPLVDALKIFNGVQPNFDLLYLFGRIIVNENDVKFYLHTQEIDGDYIGKSDVNNINPDLEIKMIIHGWTENSKNNWYRSITKEYLNKQNYNIIYVDWEKPSSFDYILSAMNCKEVGQIIGRFLINLNVSQRVPLDNIHLIGHSLGAHVAGFAGKEVKKETGNEIERITGLDPAGPYFEHPFKNPAERLSNNDAKIVDVIHTDGGFFGAINPMGTIDFYVNGGVRPQPGCTTITFGTPTNLESVVPVVFCSHVKSYMYFIESINSNSYQAIKCDSWKSYEGGNCNSNEKATFGANVEPGKTGNYFIAINH